MNVLMFGQDKAHSRLEDYRKLVSDLDYIVVTKQNYFSLFFYTPKVRPDLVTSQDPFEIGFLGWILAKRFKAKLQLQVHTDFMSPYYARESLRNKFRVALAKFLLPKADGVRVVSERIKQSLGVPSVVLPIYVDTEKLKNSKIETDLHKRYPQFDFIFLMASRITREKNINLAIDAMREINGKAGLMIVGGRGENSNNVVFEEWTEDLASYYKTANCFLLTSNYEGYGRTLIEAAAVGLPIISTDVGVAREIGAQVCPAGDKGCLVTKMKEAIKIKQHVNYKLNLSTYSDYLAQMKKSWQLTLQR